MPTIDELFKRYLENKCSNEELETLLHYFEHVENQADVDKLIENELQSSDNLGELKPALERIVTRNRAAISDIPAAKTGAKQGFKKVHRIRYSVAASLLLIASFSLWFYYGHYSGQQPMEIQAGTNRAVLTLDDGRSVELRSDHALVVVGESGARYADGTSIVSSSIPQVATLSVPRAGQYQVALSDGSQVWLNAASTLKYPTQFVGEERIVYLEGEAYFEVQKGAMPFVVVLAGQKIKVLGTAFNVKAYADENNIQTTLTEGKIQLTTDLGDTQVLSPGMQAILDPTGLRIQRVDIDDFVAWKEGVITLEKQTFDQVLRQLEKWYDVEFVVAKGLEVPKETLSGEVLRNQPLQALLKTLSQQTNLQFELQERRVIVKKN